MSVDQEQKIGRAPKPIRPFTLRQLEDDKLYLGYLLVTYANGDPLKGVAREFGRSPRWALHTVERVKETMQTEPFTPFDVLKILGIDIAPLSQEEKERMDRELGI